MTSWLATDNLYASVVSRPFAPSGAFMFVFLDKAPAVSAGALEECTWQSVLLRCGTHNCWGVSYCPLGF